MKTVLAALAASSLATGCNREPERQAVANQPNLAADSTPTATEARTEGGLPDDRTPLSEPKGPIDPKSAEAAGQVVQSYGALIEQRRFAEAAKLWNDQAEAAKVKNTLPGPETHLEIGKPGELEGAAGSIYVTMPVTFYGSRVAGEPFRWIANLTLRRVNDVPGSTEEQRRWHIERIEWTARD
jgi:hypothetical protein